MDKDKQIKILYGALQELAGNWFSPWHGEDAIAMREYAKETLGIYNKSFKRIAGRQGSMGDQDRG